MLHSRTASLPDLWPFAQRSHFPIASQPADADPTADTLFRMIGGCFSPLQVQGGRPDGDLATSPGERLGACSRWVEDVERFSGRCYSMASPAGSESRVYEAALNQSNSPTNCKEGRCHRNVGLRTTSCSISEPNRFAGRERGSPPCAGTVSSSTLGGSAVVSASSHRGSSAPRLTRSRRRRPHNGSGQGAYS